jgi:hypothetical protein
MICLETALPRTTLSHRAPERQSLPRLLTFGQTPQAYSYRRHAWEQGPLHELPHVRCFLPFSVCSSPPPLYSHPAEGTGPWNIYLRSCPRLLLYILMRRRLPTRHAPSHPPCTARHVSSPTNRCRRWHKPALHQLQTIRVRFEVFNGGDYEEWRLLGCYAVWLLLKTDVSEEPSASIINNKFYAQRK